MAKISEYKSIFMSKTVWGIAIGLLGSILSKYGYDIPVSMQEEITNYLIEGMIYAGAGLAMYGRIVATSKVSIL